MDTDQGLFAGEYPLGTYKGIPAHVDMDLAERILKLTPLDIHAILDDLLGNAEIEATISRLMGLQAYLKKNKSKVGVKKGKWNSKTAADMGGKLDSYVGAVADKAV